jgi:hypothetical protein
MALTAGSRLGSYEIVSAIGAGGMGEVYRARDTKLGRDVAIKVLPEQVAADADRLARFHREAQVLASLNHTHIAAIYGLEKSGAMQFLILELVEGETLSQRLKTGPLPLDAALAAAKQIAEGLEAAHEKGIIHRDLKPANIAFTTNGDVKILDFGLAKALDPGGAGGSGHDFTQSPTITTPALMTGVGMILGTAAYMAPEQAKGRAADKRSDMWAFGCVLYEMLTGRRAFEADDVAETLAAILTRHPDWTSLPATTPSPLRTLIVSCLEKDRRKRAGDIAVALMLLDDRHSSMALAGSGVAALPGPARAARGRTMAVAAGALIAGAALTVAAMTVMVRPAATPAVTRMAIGLGQGEEITASADEQPFTLSPDGRTLVFVAGGELHLRTLDTFATKVLPGTNGAVSPFFSPDGEWVGFFANNKLQKISVHGGTALSLGGSVGTPTSGSWSQDGFIVFSPQAGVQGLFRTPDTGGERASVARPESTQERFLWPEILPGSDMLLFTATNGSTPRLVAQSLKSGERHVVMEGATEARYLTSGHLLYLSGGTLMAVPFDPRQARVAGTPAPVVEGVRYSVDSGLYAASKSGTLLYVPGSLEQTLSSLVWVDRHGEATPIAAPSRNYTQFSLSPDGTRVAYTLANANSDVWVQDIAQNRSTRLTFNSVNRFPIWTPDGAYVTYAAVINGAENAYQKRADGTGDEEQITKCRAEEGSCVPDGWSPDGGQLVFHQNTNAGAADIWVAPRRDSTKANALIATPAFEEQGRVSPNGRWLAHISNESGRNEIYVQSFVGQPGKWQVSSDGGLEPAWARSGRELFFRSGQKMMVVDVTIDPVFTMGTPRVMFEKPFVAPAFPIGTSGLSPDGQRFLMLQRVDQAQPVTEINAVLNWSEELKRTVPAK